MPTTVTGFSLFMLCHDFGRRGRSMACSLARQVDLEVPIYLTVLHCNPEDAHLVGEGAAEGPTPLSVRFVQIDEGRILRRALLFSECKAAQPVSHVVFLDADLWFPPEFWREYTRALRGELPGYWSCRVMNIPFPLSEEFIDGWRDLDARRLEEASDGRRLDSYGGRVGHFQCIPSGLVRYPADPLPAVHTVDLAFAADAVARSEDQRFERRICRVGAFHFDHLHSWEGTNGRKQ